jgi:ankyrin repeat protein
MRANLTKLLHLCAALWLTACGASLNYATTMKANDFFESKPLLALAEAAANGQVDKIKQLLAEGADLNVQGKEGMTVLFWALVNENKKGFQSLLEAGANPNVQMANGDSAMSYAAMHEDTWYLETVLKHGGNPNLVDPTTGETPIYESIRRLRAKHVRMLIGAGANLNFQNKDGYTPVVTAANGNQYDLVYAMLEAGADPGVKDRWGFTVLYPIRDNRISSKSELFKWRAKVIEFLKAKGIDTENGK